MNDHPASRRRIYLTLTTIVVGFGLLCSWNIGHGGYASYYAASARSMSVNWRAFVFGAFDPSSHITLDKLSGFLIPQALSARVFGFHAWSIALPQVFEGMVTIVAVYVVATRWKGPAAGLFAAAATATTPLLVSMFGHAMEDGLLTMSLALALLTWQSAILSGRIASLLLSGFWVGVGFQAKMMQAWVILPALAVGYLLAAPHPVGHRVRQGLGAGALTIGLSIAWMTAIQLVPSSDRPYIDGSTNNNIFSMVFGYNGLNRILPNIVPGAVKLEPTPSPRSASLVPMAFTLSTNRTTRAGPASYVPAKKSTAKLLLPVYATQVGWLYPLAVGGSVLSFIPWGGAQWRRRFRTNRPLDDSPPNDALPKDALPNDPLPQVTSTSTATATTLVLWLLTAVALLSVAEVPHAAYLAAVSVQISVLAAAGFADGVSLLRTRQTRYRVVLAILVATETIWSMYIIHGCGVAFGFLLPTVAALGLTVTFILAVAAVIPTHPRFAPPRLVVIGGTVVAMLFAPFIWSGSALSTNLAGSSGEAYTGRRAPDPGTTVEPSDLTDQQNRGPFMFAVPFTTHDPRGSEAQRRLLRYLKAHYSGHGPLMTVDRWSLAALSILDSGADVVAMGGFSGRVATPVFGRFLASIASKDLQYVLLTTSTSAAQTANARAIRSWVQHRCQQIPRGQYGQSGSAPPAQSLYSCSRPSK